MTDDQNKPKVDPLTGTQTTGHEWDGLNELNTPMPRWWLWLFYATIIWAVIYMVLYPAWPVPGGATEGTLGYTQYKELSESQAEIRERQASYLAEFRAADYDQVLGDEQLFAFAVAGGEANFKDNCATCHGSGAVGRKGYPSLVDDAWLWGGDLTSIETTIRYGIRHTHPQTRVSAMPRFGLDGILTPLEIEQTARHVLSLSGKAEPNSAGAEIFEQQCSFCHGADGGGMPEVGAPNLADAIWLYGSTRAAVETSIRTGRGGVMPAWEPRMDDDTIRQLTIYVHQLGGGKPATAKTGGDDGGTQSGH